MRCKVQLTEWSRKQWHGADNAETVIKFHPVVGGSPENDAFFKYTPGGEIALRVVKDSVVQQLKLGAEYYVDFTPVTP